MKEMIVSALQELIIPEFDRIKEDNAQIKGILELTNKRLDDINIHLVDQSRRIDALREELSQRIDTTNQRMDALRDELGQRIDVQGQKFDMRLDRLFEAIVRRDEHLQVERRVVRLENQMEEISRRFAA